MTYANTESHQTAGLVSNWFSGLIAEFKTSARRYKSYRSTLIELKAMNNRELADIGISPLSIRDVARQAAEMV